MDSINIFHQVPKSIRGQDPQKLRLHTKNTINFLVDDGIGDVCQHDWDNDTVGNLVDICPNNSRVWATDFRKYDTIALDPYGKTQEDPIWEIHHNGSEIYQTMNSDPGIAVGKKITENLANFISVILSSAFL